MLADAVVAAPIVNTAPAAVVEATATVEAIVAGVEASALPSIPLPPTPEGAKVVAEIQTVVKKELADAVTVVKEDEKLAAVELADAKAGGDQPTIDAATAVVDATKVLT